MSAKATPLTWDELESYQAARNKTRPPNRYFCPVHRGQKQPSLQVYKGDGSRWKCHDPECEAWGYLDKDETWTPRKPEPKPKTYQEMASKYNRPVLQKQPAPINIADLEQLQTCQEALPGSPGQRYLEARGIDLETAQLYGIGFSPSGLPMSAWKWGRLIIPHTDPAGAIVSLYGRAVDGITDKQAPRADKHRHLEGPKGVFNAPALLEPVVLICEGAFDALAMLCCGYPAVALYGLNVPWGWVKSETLVFCLDGDGPGDQAWDRLGWEADIHDKKVYRFPVPQGCKDISEAWMNGVFMDLFVLDTLFPG